MPILLLRADIRGVGEQVKSINELVAPRDVFLLGAGLLFGRMSDLISVKLTSKRIFLYVLFGAAATFGVWAGVSIEAHAILHKAYQPGYLHYFDWPVAIVYMIIITALISFALALQVQEDRTGSDLVDELRELQELRDDGILTRQMYETQAIKVIDSIEQARQGNPDGTRQHR
jgi:hypothetical protein